MQIPKPPVIDFEALPIEGRPHYPPAPVGVSILLPGERAAKYYAFGHPSENNCTKRDAARKTAEAYAIGRKTKSGVLCHHAKFDLDVAEVHFDLALPPWELIHDTMFLLFLSDPHSPDLKLKPAAERLLNMPPEESDALREYAIAQKWIAKNAKGYGKYICKMPGGLVGTYANGDTLRTLRLFQKLWPDVHKRGMGTAYDRERRLLPVLLANERQGVPVNFKLMKADDAKYENAGLIVDTWIRKQLKVGDDFNLDSDEQLADAMVLRRKANPDLFMLTATGRRSTAKDSLIGAVTDKKFLQAMQYRARLATAYGTFLHPWFLEAKESGGLVFPNWNQVRQAGQGNNSAGAKTGRLSVSRFMNVPKEFKERETGANAYKHPSHISELPELPFMRLYMQPFKGEVWCKRDYMQQELRVLGHYGDGALMERFRADPTLDVHDTAAYLINEQFGIPVTRDDTKTIGFGLLYGLGLGGLAERLGVSVHDAGTIKDAYMGIFPELPELQKGLRGYASEGVHFTTWGGRQYFCEPPKWSDKFGRNQTFEYKMLNYLIQGSSADCTKEAVIRYDGAKQHGRFLLTVHDEINLSVPKPHVRSEMQLLREVMASIEFDVPMLSDGGTGPSWGELKKFKEAPLILAPWQ